MAISITSLYPLKNAIDIPVDANVELTLKSDSADLDVTTVKFWINDIEIKASSKYSIEALTGQDKTEVLVAFYPRRRIKFGNERYGATDTRYGKLDINVSNFIYDSRYVCRIYIEDESGNSYEDSFAFTTEEGVFINPSPPLYYYSTVTQDMANYLPDWTRARYDKFSNFQQIANPAGVVMEEFEKKIREDFLSNFVQTANYNELANFYRVELGSNFSFKRKFLDDGDSLIVPPDVSAIYNISKIYPTSEFNNDIKSVYYDKIPDRIESIKERYSSEILSETRVSIDKISLEYKMEREGKFCVTTKNGTKFTVKDPTLEEQLLPLRMRIVGVSSQDAEQTEDISIIDNDTYFTIKRWSYIESIQFLDYNESNSDDFTFRLDIFPPNDAIQTDIFRHYESVRRFQDSSWAIEPTNYGTLLKELVYTSVEPDEVVASLGARTEVNEYELLDINGQDAVNAISFCVDPFSYNIYAIDANHLYIYDKREPYPEVLNKIKPSPTEAQVSLVMETNNLGRTDSPKVVAFSAYQKLLDKKVIKYFYSVQKPDETIDYVDQLGQIFPTAKQATTIVESNLDPINSRTVSYEMDILGDYVIGLHVQYSNGSVSTDFKVARLMGKAALAKYRLDRILLNEDAQQIIYDFDGKIKIIDTVGFVHTLYFAKDNMLIDYEKSTIYFNEDYREVMVDE